MDSINVVNQKWDYLIILDACRFDYFESIYQEYLKGDLQKCISSGSCTNEWKVANFPDIYDDIVYISANPFFAQDQEVSGYNAGEHFHKVYEIWRDYWDKGTVLPECVTDAVPDIVNRHTGKRFIIHYLQPHAPYLILQEDARGYATAEGDGGREIAGEQDYFQASAYKRKMCNLLVKLFEWNNILGNHPEWFIRKWLRLPPRAPMEFIIHNYNRRILRSAYKANLKIVLKSVVQLLSSLSGRIIVTSDHGEFLGENRLYSHPQKSTHPILLEVPWLVIDRPECDVKPLSKVKNVQSDKNMPIDASEDEQSQIKQRLREIGYL